MTYEIDLNMSLSVYVTNFREVTVHLCPSFPICKMGTARIAPTFYKAVH